MPIVHRTVSLNVHRDEGRKDFDPQREHRNMTRIVIDEIYPVNKLPEAFRVHASLIRALYSTYSIHNTKATASLLLVAEV